MDSSRGTWYQSISVSKNTLGRAQVNLITLDRGTRRVVTEHLVVHDDPGGCECSMTDLLALGLAAVLEREIDLLNERP